MITKSNMTLRKITSDMTDTREGHSGKDGDWSAISILMPEVGHSVPAEADKGAPCSTQLVHASSHNNPSKVLVASPKLPQPAHLAIGRPRAKKGEAYQ